MSWEEMVRAEAAEKLLIEALGASYMGDKVTTGDVKLECGHILHFDIATPHKKEVLWCRRCERERNVAQVGSGKSFRVKCRTCKYTRGKDGELGAETAAAGHRAKRAHHVVDILDSTGTVVRTFQDDAVMVPQLPDEPPY